MRKPEIWAGAFGSGLGICCDRGADAWLSLPPEEAFDTEISEFGEVPWSFDIDVVENVGIGHVVRLLMLCMLCGCCLPMVDSIS